MAWGVQSGEALYHTTCSTHYPGLVGQTTDIFKFKFHLDLHNTKQQSLGYKPPWTVSSGCFNWQVDTCRSQLLSLRIRMSALDLPTLSVVFLMEGSNTEHDLHVAVRVCGYNLLLDLILPCWCHSWINNTNISPDSTMQVTSHTIVMSQFCDVETSSHDTSKNNPNYSPITITTIITQPKPWSQTP